MKYLALAILLSVFVVVANAVEVTATGVGVTEEQAIRDAKNNALEQVTGAFVVSSAESTGRSVRQRVSQYSGGYVRRFELISSTDYGNSVEVKILADVDPRKNNAVVVPTEVDITQQGNKLQEEADRSVQISRMGKSLDDRKQAFAAMKPKVSFEPRGEKTMVTVLAGVQLQPKWIDDVKQWSKIAGHPIDVSTRTSDVLWVVGTATAPFSMIGSSLVRSAANFTTETQPTQYYDSNCFSVSNDKDVSECYALGYLFGNVIRNDRFVVVVTLWSGSRMVQEMPVAVVNANRLFAFHESGTRLYFKSSAKERKFHSKGVVWFTDGVAAGTNTFLIDTEKLATVDRMEYALR